jgi:hypothetical protein
MRTVLYSAIHGARPALTYHYSIDPEDEQTSFLRDNGLTERSM